MKSKNYQEFVEKFKPKLTTDDCYTPPTIYDIVADWVTQEYGVQRWQMVRPFKPGGDYKAEQYGMMDVVVDNPPFSILQEICCWYQERGIPFFLFAPHLTAISTCPGVTTIITDTDIIYHNGANVRTAFRTNLDKVAIRTAPTLRAAIVAETKRLKNVKPLPRYIFPPNVLTVSKVQAVADVDFSVGWQESQQVRQLQSMKSHGKAMFGNGYVVSDTAADRYKEAQVKEAQVKEAQVVQTWELSDKEQAIIADLNKKVVDC
jgi:hypothetical protein